MLGEGISGRVFKAYYQSPDQKFDLEIALKIIPQKRVSLQELDILTQMLHPNIVRHLHTFDHLQDGFMVQ